MYRVGLSHGSDSWLFLSVLSVCILFLTLISLWEIALCLYILWFVYFSSKVLFFSDDWLFVFFVCASNISGTAERIYAKFTQKTCLVPRSHQFHVKAKGQGHGRQKRAVHSHHPRQRQNGTCLLQITSGSSGRDNSVAAGGWCWGPVCGLCLVKDL